MRSRPLLWVLLVIGVLACVPASRYLEAISEYGKAEPLVGVVWPLAHDMQLFAKERGRPPVSLEEVQQFAPDHDLSILRDYPHAFQQTGPQRFLLQVNAHFGFEIDEEFNPRWSHQSSLLSP